MLHQKLRTTLFERVLSRRGQLKQHPLLPKRIVVTLEVLQVGELSVGGVNFV